MANKFTRVSNFGVESHFSEAVTGELAFSRMLSSPTELTTFNAGDIVPIGCFEVLPHDTFAVDLDFVIRQTTALKPTMGSMKVDFYAFEVPNRVVNDSFVNVMGENSSGSWVANDVSLAPLVKYQTGETVPDSVQIPVGSVADHYGFATQAPIPTAVLEMCHDLKFRGYVAIYNEYFRDQNYQPPIPLTKLNVYQNFLHLGTYTNYDGSSDTLLNFSVISGVAPADGSFGAGAVIKSVYGEGAPYRTGSSSPENASMTPPPVFTSNLFNALGAPLKANKLHDYFTSVLPSPQRGAEVLLPINGMAPLALGTLYKTGGATVTQGIALTNSTFSPTAINGFYPLMAHPAGSTASGSVSMSGTNATGGSAYTVDMTNLYADLSNATGATLAELRTAAAVQQIYEALARGGTRFREIVRVLFGLEVDDPFNNIPRLLGHFRRELDLYQTAQTSQSAENATPQGNLAAFGYTASNGYLFKKTFLEHGYVHIIAVVRHKNIYSSLLSRDNFRMNMLDFYTPQLANISEQPVYTREINPWAGNAQAFGYQEAWAEYRYDPDRCSGLMRPGVPGSLAVWNYADDYNSSLQIATGEWLKSNSQFVLDRTLAVQSLVVENAPQLLGQFRFRIDKERPMPTYSIPGLDIF